MPPDSPTSESSPSPDSVPGMSSKFPSELTSTFVWKGFKYTIKRRRYAGVLFVFLLFFCLAVFPIFIFFVRNQEKMDGTIPLCRPSPRLQSLLLDEDESHDEEDEPPRELSGSENNAEPEDKNLKSIIHNEESHTCPTKQQRDVAAGGVAVVFSPSETARVICVKDEMKVMTQELALSETKMSSISIAQRVQDKIERKYDKLPVKGFNSCQLKAIVHYTRRKEFADWEGAIASFPLVLCSDDDRLFLQFNATVNLQNSLQKIIGWGHPDLIHLLKYGAVNTFIDCTFSCVPKGFEQCLIVMVYDRPTSLYVPVFYVLLQSKLENAYFHALQLCISSADWQFTAKTITCDFEQAVLNVVEANFPSVPVIGCVFHWKQALRRKLLAYHIPKDVISRLMDFYSHALPDRRN